jgi:hypothetical protein
LISLPGSAPPTEQTWLFGAEIDAEIDPSQRELAEDVARSSASSSRGDWI